MATTVRISLDTRKNSQKEDGTYPIILRLKHQGSNRTICALEYYSTKADWDTANQCLKKTYKLVSNISRTNNYFAKRKTLAYDVINELKDTNEIEDVSINELNTMIRKRITGKEPQKKLRKPVERKPLEWEHCKELYVNYLYNIDIPKHKQRNRDLNYVKGVEMYLRRFEEFVQSPAIENRITKVTQITDKVVGKYFEFVEETTSSNASFNHHFRAVRSFYNFLIEERGYTIANPFKKVALRYEGTLPKSISKAEFDRLLEIISLEDSILEYKPGVRKNMYRPYLKYAFRLTLLTGRRTEEIVSLRWNNIQCDANNEPLYIESIDLKANRQANFNQAQRNKTVFIPVIPQLKALLYEMGFELLRNTSMYLIAPKDPSSRKTIMNNLSKGFTFYYKKLNTGKDISLKHLRKTYLTHLQIITGNAIGVSGHSSEDVLDNHYIDKIEIAKSVAKSNLSILE